MLFNSFEFLFFFVCFVAVYYATSGRLRIIVCLLASYFFYGCWDYRFLGLILFSTVVDFYVGLKISAASNKAQARKFLLVSLVVNLGLLAVFKYFNFFVDSLITLLHTMGVTLNFSTLSIILPVGISFYTFQTLSYSIDLYRKEITEERDFFRFATYVAFFPQLVAGPIVRAKDLLPQFRKNQKFTFENLHAGLYQTLLGFFKKIVVADTVAVLVDKVFFLPENYSFLMVLLGVIFYAFQIYCDFSGYSDIAIGTARILGFTFPENFKTPYFSKGFSEFWRRWHITLSSWLRDYLYISLGGNRNGIFMTYRNLMLTMLLGGLWHGASWNFVFWGALHGSYLVIERNTKRWTSNIPLPGFFRDAISILCVFALTCFAWIFFRSVDFSTSIIIIKQLNPFSNPYLFNIQHMYWLFKGILVILLLIGIDYFHYHYDLFMKAHYSLNFRYITFIFFISSICFLGTFNGNQFIYFQF